MSKDARPRFLVCLSGGGKASMLFQAGALMALRALDILRFVKVFSASGTGCLVLHTMMNAQAQMPTEIVLENNKDNDVAETDVWGQARMSTWERLVIHSEHRRRQNDDDNSDDDVKSSGDNNNNDDDGPDVFVECVVKRILAFACESQELWMAKRRLDSPARWSFSPWQTEMLEYWSLKNWTGTLEASMLTHAVSRTARTKSKNREPYFLWTGTQTKGDRPICFTNDLNRETSKHLHVEFQIPDPNVRLDALAIACGLPEELGSFEVGTEQGKQVIGNACKVDAFGLTAASLYFTKQKLNFIPGVQSEESESDISNKLILLDGLSGTPAIAAMGDGTRLSVRNDIALVASSADSRNETPRLYMHQHCLLMDTQLSEVSSMIGAFFAAVTEHGDVRLEQMNRHTATQCINWGYLKALRCYAPNRKQWKPTRMPFGESDPYGMIPALFS